MKKILVLLSAFFCCQFVHAQNGMNLNVNISAYKGQVIYLGYYFGKGQYVSDSVKLDEQGNGTFKSKEKLPGGIYFIVFPGKRSFSEFVLDKNQQFSISIKDTLSPLEHSVFTNSPENDHYRSYQMFIGKSGTEIRILEQDLANAKTAEDSTAKKEKLSKARKKIVEWRDDFKQKYPNEILTAFFKALDEPVVPPAEKHPGGKYDTTFAYNYYKQHFWDGVSFSDERLVRTPFFEPKIDKYFDNVLIQAPDTVYNECIKMIDAGKPNKETAKFLLDKLIRKYVNPTYMGQDVVFVHLYERYFLDGTKYDWVNEKYKKFLSDRYYSLVANIVGEKAYDFEMVDTLGAVKKLYAVDSKYTIVCFWDPTCGHCQQEVPKVDSMFQNRWNKMGITLIGVMVDGGKEAWMKYIREHNLKGWQHWYQSEEQKTAEKNSGRASYKQLYDVFQTPILYLLDKEKRIVAKRLNYEQLNELLDRKEKNSKG